MNMATLSVNLIALIALMLAFIKDRKKANQALRVAFRSFFGMLPMVLIIVVLIGILLGFVTPRVIEDLVGEESGVAGILTAMVIGALMHIPAIMAFPLASSLLESGAAVGTVAGFITSLTMIGALTFPLEAREMGLKFTVLRNGLGFLFALAIALTMGALL
jgi:uncharacterized membrane protein YraQ (UPF0718 family)